MTPKILNGFDNITVKLCYKVRTITICFKSLHQFQFQKIELCLNRVAFHAFIILRPAEMEHIYEAHIIQIFKPCFFFLISEQHHATVIS